MIRIIRVSRILVQLSKIVLPLSVMNDAGNVDFVDDGSDVGSDGVLTDGIMEGKGANQRFAPEFDFPLFFLTPSQTTMCEMEKGTWGGKGKKGEKDVETKRG